VFDIHIGFSRDRGDKKHKQPRIEGAISQLLVRNIHVRDSLAMRLYQFSGVPPWRGKADPFDEPDKFAPRYFVKLMVGSRHEPWIESVRLADQVE
jgi:hypothetical protein